MIFMLFLKRCKVSYFYAGGFVCSMNLFDTGTRFHQRLQRGLNSLAVLGVSLAPFAFLFCQDVYGSAIDMWPLGDSLPCPPDRFVCPKKTCMTLGCSSPWPWYSPSRLEKLKHFRFYFDRWFGVLCQFDGYIQQLKRFCWGTHLFTVFKALAWMLSWFRVPGMSIGRGAVSTFWQLLRIISRWKHLTTSESICRKSWPYILRDVSCK